MRSKTKSIKIPAILAEVGETQAIDLGYPSFNAFVTGLLRYSLLTDKPHTLTVPISKMSLDDQDRIDQEIAEVAKSGKGAKGQWLEHIIERAAEKALAANPEASKSELAKLTRESLQSGG